MYNPVLIRPLLWTVSSFILSDKICSTYFWGFRKNFWYISMQCYKNVINTEYVTNLLLSIQLLICLYKYIVNYILPYKYIEVLLYIG